MNTNGNLSIGTLQLDDRNFDDETYVNSHAYAGQIYVGTTPGHSKESEHVLSFIAIVNIQGLWYMANHINMHNNSKFPKVVSRSIDLIIQEWLMTL